MNRMLLRKYIGEAILLWCVCALALFAFAWVRVWVSGLFEFGEVQEILDRFRRFERFSPIPFDQLASYEGRVGMTFDEPLVLLCILVWGIARGSDVVSGEIGRGTMEILLAQPISRWNILWTHGLVAVAGLTGLVLAHWGGLWCGVQTTTVLEKPRPIMIDLPLIPWSIPLPMESYEPLSVPLRERIDAGLYLAASINLFSLGFFVLAMSTLASSWERWRWRSIGIVVGVHAFQTVLFGLSRADPQLSGLRFFTYCSCYCPQFLTQVASHSELGEVWNLKSANQLGPMAFPLFLLAFGIFMYTVSGMIFNRRSIPPPL